MRERRPQETADEMPLFPTATHRGRINRPRVLG